MIHRLLIVDDARAVHLYIKDALTGTSCEFRDAYDGNEALAELTRSPDFSAILLDWEMPNLTGIATLKEIRRRAIATPVIMVTTLNDPARISEAIDAGANDYIMKPFTKDILLPKLLGLIHGDSYAI